MQCGISSNHLASHNARGLVENGSHGKREAAELMAPSLGTVVTTPASSTIDESLKTGQRPIFAIRKQDQRRHRVQGGDRFGVARQQGSGIAVEEFLDRGTGDVWRPR